MPNMNVTSSFSFVTFYTDYLRKERSSAMPSPAEELMLFANSARATNKKAKLIVLTDKSTKIPEPEIFDHIYRYNISYEELMLSRLHSQIDFVKFHSQNLPVVFIDSDTLILNDLEYLFANLFDIGYAIDEQNIARRINNGVYFVKKTSDRIVQFLKMMSNQILDMPLGMRKWGGNEDIINEILSNLNEGEVLQWNGINFWGLQACRYNRIPTDTFLDAVGVDILHFQGDKKVYMQDFFNLLFIKNRD